MHKDKHVFNTRHRIALVGLIVAGTSAVALADPEHGHGMKGGEPGQLSEVTRTIRIEARDIAFDKARIEVKEGETVRFVITNVGELVHDFTLGPPDVQERHRYEMVKMMQDGMMDGAMTHDDPNAVLVKPGETKELIWKFSEADDFEFGCNQHGHYEVGMKGRIHIED